MWPIESKVTHAFIESLPGYRFSRDGGVSSCWVRGSKRHRTTCQWHDIKPIRNARRDYLYVTLKTPSGRRSFRVNVLILWAFTGWRPVGLEAAHKDGDRLNNQIDNLEWKTHSQNIDDKLAHGTMRRGQQIPSSVLTEPSVARIKCLIRTMSCEAIGRMFGVSGRTICKIANGETWKHVKEAI